MNARPRSETEAAETDFNAETAERAENFSRKSSACSANSAFEIVSALSATSARGRDYITRDLRITASAFCRISRDTSKGSPCWNRGRKSSTEREPA